VRTNQVRNHLARVRRKIYENPKSKAEAKPFLFLDWNNAMTSTY